MTVSEIQNDVPAPTPQARGRFPYKLLEPGQSFEVHADNLEEFYVVCNTLRCICYQYSSRMGREIRFTTRTFPKLRKVRVWRIA